MRERVRELVALLLCESLMFPPAASGQNLPKGSGARPGSETLARDLRKSYLKLLEISPKLEFSPEEIESQRKALKQGEDFCVNRFKGWARRYDNDLDSMEKQLKAESATLGKSGRHNLHCKIQGLRALASEAKVLSGQGIPVAYDNMEAKLDIIERWPAEHRRILAAIADGSYQNRRWGDVKDIGFRQIERGQEDDIKTGQEAIQQMKQNGLMPPAIGNKAIQDYVQTVAQRVAAHSDLHIPLHVTVLNSKEINSFALPGGYLFVERGLLEAADDESELAGVIGHEISHEVARHSHRLMEKATIAGIFYQAAEIAAVVFTGGVASIGMYYALQYGFYGLGLVLDLKLLGVSREYELEADQLGIQYAWNSGYDPTGFIRFFDKMATKEGHVNGLSWFRTHPPFYERMVNAEREIDFLPKKPNYVVQTSAFEQMKKELRAVTAKAEKEKLKKPSLLVPERGCPAPAKIRYTAGEPIEKLCGAPLAAADN